MSDLGNGFIDDADKPSKFIKFVDGESVIGKYKNAQMEENSFRKGEKTMRYFIEIDGVEKSFSSQSIKLVRLMSKFKTRDLVEITKTGTGTRTLWYADHAIAS